MVQDIIAALHRFKSEKRASQANCYYPASMKVISISVPNEKIIIREIRNKTIFFRSKKTISERSCLYQYF